MPVGELTIKFLKAQGARGELIPGQSRFGVTQQTGWRLSNKQ